MIFPPSGLFKTHMIQCEFCQYERHHKYHKTKGLNKNYGLSE